jgi:hypothetical protein
MRVLQINLGVEAVCLDGRLLFRYLHLLRSFHGLPKYLCAQNSNLASELG